MTPSSKKIYLCTPDLHSICVLNGVQTNSVEYHPHVKDYDTLRFTVDRYIIVNGEQLVSNGYEDIDVYMYLYLEDIGYFQMQAPTVENDGNNEVKEVIAYSIDKEFEDKDWIGLKINTGEYDSIEYLADNNVDAMGFAINYVTMLNNANHQLSFLHLMLEKMPDWGIGTVDASVEHRKIPSLSVDNSTLYAIMTSNVAPRMNVLFEFDTLNKLVNVHSQDNLDYDTSIYIGYRNLANHITIDVDENSVFTRFRVRGDGELNVRDYNYNDEQVEDLSYFACEPWMSDELAQKYLRWKAFRDAHRQEFVELAKREATINELIYQKNYQVPADETYWKNWDSMREDGLRENLEYWKLYLETLQIMVDPRPDSEKYDQSGKYLPVMDGDKVDHDYYIQLLSNDDNWYKGYHTYLEIVTYIIPYIEQAIINLDLPTDQKVKYGDEAAEDWELYGYIELDGKRQYYEDDALPALHKYSKPWSELTEEEKLAYVNEAEYNKIGHNEYVHITTILGDKNNPAKGTLYYRLNQLKTEIDALKAELQELGEERGKWANTFAVDARSDVLQPSGINREEFFTSDEIIVLRTLFHDTDYTNSNIVTTSLDTISDTIDREKDLYDDALDKLSAVSQPQFKFSVDLDNFLRIPEFEGWKEDFKLLRFIRLGIREDYQVKMRIVGYTWNPCEVTPTLSLEFSNMISSRSGRTDFEDIINSENNRGSKNSISVGTGNAQSDLQLSSSILELLRGNPNFSKIINNVIDSNGISIDSAAINNLIADYLSAVTIEANTINVKNITGETADFNEVFTRYLGADVIAAKIATVGSLEADSAFVKYLQSISSTTVSSVVDREYVKNLVANYITVADLAASDIVLTDAMKIVSENGKLIMNGRALQIIGQDSQGQDYVGIQLGYDTSENPSLILRNSEGATVLTPQGITSDAIADQLIVNNMIHDSTISEDKLNFAVMKEGDHVLLENIYTSAGEQFGVEYTRFQQEVSDRIDELKDLGLVSLSGEQIFILEDDGSISPDFVTLTASINGSGEIANWYINGEPSTVFVSQDKLSMTIPAEYMRDKKMVIVRVEMKTGEYDEMTVAKLENGSSNITVIINSTNGIIFSADTEYVDTLLECVVYRGAVEITPNSYEWFVNNRGNVTARIRSGILTLDEGIIKLNDGGSYDWESLKEYGSSITVKVPRRGVTEQYKCVVDVD